MGGGLQNVARADGQQLRVSGARAHEEDPAASSGCQVGDCRHCGGISASYLGISGIGHSGTF